MVHGEPVGAKHPGDQQPPVTAFRVFLRAEERQAVLGRAALDTSDTGLKKIRAGHPVVPDVPLGVVIFLTSRPSAQLFSQKRIADPGAGQRGAQRIAVEVGRVPGVRLRSGVHHDLDPVPA